MDKIWDRKSFEVGDHWSLWPEENNRITTQNRQKSNAKKNKKKTNMVRPKEVYVHHLLNKIYFAKRYNILLKPLTYITSIL